LRINGLFGKAGETVTLKAHLSGGGINLAEREVTFKVYTALSNGSLQKQEKASTDDEGIATMDYTIPASALKGKPFYSVKISADFNGDLAPKDGVRYLKSFGNATLRMSGPPKEEPVEPVTPAVTPAETTQPAASATEGGGATEPPPPPAQAEEKSLEELNAILSGEMRKEMGERASEVRPAAVASENGVSTEAVGLHVNGFHAAAPRFWLEAQLIRLVTEPKKMYGIAVPGVSDLKAEIRFALVDSFTEVRQEWTTSKKKPGISFKFPVNLGEKTADRINKTLVNNASEESADGKVVLKQVLGSSDGQILRDALRGGIEEANKRAAKAEWLVRVVSVSGDKIYLSGGKGCNVTVGQKLVIKELTETIKDGENVVDTVYTPRAVVEVTELREKTIVVKKVSGDPVKKGFLATTQLSDAQTAPTQVGSKP